MHNQQPHTVVNKVVKFHGETSNQNYARLQAKAGSDKHTHDQVNKKMFDTEPSGANQKVIANESYKTAAFEGDHSHIYHLPDSTIGNYIQPVKFTDIEKKLISKVIKGIASFMAIDNMSFMQIFGKYDFSNSNCIDPDDLAKAISHDLYIDLKEDIIQLV